MMNLPVHERFHAFQGEGNHAGRSAFFIRTYGCPVHCPWCDSAGTWHPHWKPPAGLTRISNEQLAQEASACKPEFVVITGGEPTIYDLSELCEALLSSGLPVHLETSGSFPIQGLFDWITVSPKRWREPLPYVLESGVDEYKFIVEAPEDIGFYYQMLRRIGGTDPYNIWLHPEWSKRHDPDVLRAICLAVKENGSVFRAGYQLHKLYRVDTLDSRTAPLAPLGGDVSRGY